MLGTGPEGARDEGTHSHFFLAAMLYSQAALLRRQHDLIFTGLPGRPSPHARIPLLALFNSTCHCRNLKDMTAKLQNRDEWQCILAALGQRIAELHSTVEEAAKGGIIGWYLGHQFFHWFYSFTVSTKNICSLPGRLACAPCSLLKAQNPLLCIRICLFLNSSHCVQLEGKHCGYRIKKCLCLIPCFSFYWVMGRVQGQK